MSPRPRRTIGIQTQESTLGIAPKTFPRSTDLQATRVTAAQLELIGPRGLHHSRLHYSELCSIEYRPQYFCAFRQDALPKTRFPDTHLRDLAAHFSGFRSTSVHLA
jgi:hypothetical protein